MNFEEEMKKLSKLRSNDPLVQALIKYSFMMNSAIDVYRKTHDMKINRTRQDYESSFNRNCRRAKKKKQDLWVYLSTSYMIPEERHLIKPPNTLKNKKKRQDWIKKEFKPYFYEWHSNNFVNPFMYAFNKGWESYRERGKKGGGQGTQEKITRQEIITQTVEKLNNDGIKNPTNLHIAKKIPGENEGYVQKFRAKQKKEESRC